MASDLSHSAAWSAHGHGGIAFWVSEEALSVGGLHCSSRRAAGPWEAILGAADFDADEAERYGWVNRALPGAELDAFVARLARRIASFPPRRCDQPSRCSTA
jgi:hypothetical protein